jgi:hypothetical protein
LLHASKVALHLLLLAGAFTFIVLINAFSHPLLLRLFELIKDGKLLG